MEDLIRGADAITVHVPLTRSTRNLIGEAEIASMKPGALPRQRRPRRGHRGGRAGQGLDRGTPRRRRSRRLHRGAAQGVAAPLGAQHDPDAAPRRVDGRGTDARRGRGRRAGAGRARRSARSLRGQRAARAAGDGAGPCAVSCRSRGRWAVFYAQFAPDLSGLTLEVAGELAAHDTSPLVAAALAGLLEPGSESRVNVVNAPSIAKARGISLVERKVGRERAASRP